VNDRGPFSRKRLIDVSEQTAELLDFKQRGMAQVRVEYVARAEVEGSDNQVLLASYRGPNEGSPAAAQVKLAYKAPPRREGISAPGHVPPPPKIVRRRPAPELAFGTTTPVSAAPKVNEAVVLISTPASADARITTAFDTASAALQ
jgi:rare lipoprotein A